MSACGDDQEVIRKVELLVDSRDISASPTIRAVQIA
jgi:hypothetical protein